MNQPVDFSKIDFGLLREQKQHLLHIIMSESDREDEDKNLSNDQILSLEGILALLDVIQDYAVDELGYDASVVYTSEDND